jgi:hypothetical protein
MRHLVFLVVMAFSSNIWADNQVFFIQPSSRMPIDTYQVATKNVSELSVLKEKNIHIVLRNKVDENTSSNSLLCRGWFPIVTSQSETFESVIEKAFSQELAQGGILSDKEGITVSIDSIKTNFNTVGTATWEYEMTLSNNNKSETFSYKHEYGTYFVAANVCNATGQNFTRGIEAFLKSLYSDPRFLALLQ